MGDVISPVDVVQSILSGARAGGGGLLPPPLPPPLLADMSLSLVARMSQSCYSPGARNTFFSVHTLPPPSQFFGRGIASFLLSRLYVFRLSLHRICSCQARASFCPNPFPFSLLFLEASSPSPPLFTPPSNSTLAVAHCYNARTELTPKCSYRGI